MPDTPTSPATMSNLARSILRKNLRVRPGENVTIEAWTHTLPYAVALAREARRLKAHPVILYEDERSFWDSVAAGESELLGANPDHEWACLAKTDVFIHMWGPGDRVRLNALPAKHDVAFAWFTKWYATARRTGLRGARLGVGRPFPSFATAYAVDQQHWTDRMVAATMVDPAKMARRAMPLARMLERGRRLRITHENGTDLTLGLAKRRAYTYVGRPVVGDPKQPFEMLCNLPAGSVRVALDERVAEGTLVGNRTSFYDDGITGMTTQPTFEFAGGRLTSARFATGQEAFDHRYAEGGIARDRPGFFSVGLNPEVHNTPKAEDVEAGAVLLGLGGNRQLGGRNPGPYFRLANWAVLADARVEVDGKPLPPVT
ncbi:MAG: aminopeptidase [Thermoplasmata archaeon]